MSRQLEIISAAIAMNDREGLIDALGLLPISRLTIEKSNELLVLFVSLTIKYNHPYLTREVLHYFEEISEDDRTIPPFTYLFTLSSVDNNILKYLVTNLIENTFVQVIMDLIDYDSSDITKMACQRAIDIFDKTEGFPNTLKELYDLALEKENTAVAEIMERNYINVSPFAEKPKWIGNYTNMNEIPRDNQIIVPENITPQVIIPETIEEQVDFLLAGMREIGIGIDDIETAKSSLSEQFAQITPQLRLQLIKPSLINNTKKYLADDVELFRIFGPANLIYGADLTTDHICSKYGGCRMFTCVCFETTEQDDDAIYETSDVNVDWFLGYCEICLKRINNRYHAIREPLVHGGWKGCFCSFNCLRDSFNVPAIGSMAIIEAVETQLNELGIQDRIDTNGKEKKAEVAIMDEKDLQFLQDTAEEEMSGVSS